MAQNKLLSLFNLFGLSKRKRKTSIDSFIKYSSSKIRSKEQTRPVWTGFKISVRHELLTHNNTRLYTAYATNII